MKLPEYKIDITYITGNSFSQETRKDTIQWPYSYSKSGDMFTVLETAKENLQRIKQHKEWLRSLDSRVIPVAPTPLFVSKWFQEPVKRGTYGNLKPSFSAENYIYLLDSENMEIMISCFWIGHFERLLSAKIVSKEEDGWSFEI